MATPNNLPAELSSFVGRDREVAELRRLMRRSRLITLSGPGGVGKTRLALRVASTMAARYSGGAWVVELGALVDPSLVDLTVAAACGIREEKARPVIELLVKRFSGVRTLLVLDGGEHLIDSCALTGAHLLKNCPDLTLLVTSREPLGIQGELIWRVPSLTVPSAGQAGNTELLLKSEAIRLFIDRARLTQPKFRIDKTVSIELADICVRLEGLPLAIELAARLVGAMTIHEIQGRLSDRFRLLTRGSRGAVPRHQTLRQAVDWSYDLLTSAEKGLFTRLAVFAGGFDADSAEAISGWDTHQSGEIHQVLMRLVDKSLVIAESPGPARMRYRLLDTIREYALEKLEHEWSLDARRRHAIYFIDFCNEAATHLLRGEHAPSLKRLGEEEPNIRLALTWCHAESPDKLVELTASLVRFWFLSGRFKEALDWLDKALEDKSGNSDTRLRALLSRAQFRRICGDYEGAWRDAEEGATLARAQGAHFPLFRALTVLATLSGTAGRWSDAEHVAAEALQLAEHMGDGELIAGTLNNLALIDSYRGNGAAARLRIDQALQQARKADKRTTTAHILETAGGIEHRLGSVATARQRYLEALHLTSENENVVTVANVLDGLGLLALSEADPTRTLVLVAASSREREATNVERAPLADADVQQGVLQAAAMLSQRAADLARKRGSAMSLTEAIAYASGATGAAIPNAGSPLTRREMQVATLISEGMTNLEIAARLKMADRTADAHVEHIRNKLGLRSRSQIAVWAHERLVDTSHN